jgi:hypothetical protein
LTQLQSALVNAQAQPQNVSVTRPDLVTVPPVAVAAVLDNEVSTLKPEQEDDSLAVSSSISFVYFFF